jgi:phosphate acetyltransferase
MSNNLYITATEPQSGKSVIALGVMEFLIRNLNRVAFFRPIINTGGGSKKDGVNHLISEHYQLGIPYRKMFAFTFEQARTLIAEGQHDRLLEGILNSYKALEAGYDFVLCLGTDFEGESSAFEFDLNAEIANNLGAPLLVVANAHQENVEDIVKSCVFAVEAFEEKGCNIISLIFNRTPAAIQATLPSQLRHFLKSRVPLIYSLPGDKTLESMTMAEIANALGCRTLVGEDQMDRLVSRFVVAAMNLRTYLPRLTDNSLVITPFDRLDIILGTLAAFRSRNMPEIAGMILTGYRKADKTLMHLLEGMSQLVPILKTPDDTFTTAMKVNQIRTDMTPGDSRKIAVGLGLFETHVDTTELRRQIVGYTPSIVTPKMFEFGLIKRARSHKQKIVLPEGEEERILRAAEILIHRDAAEFVLLGDPETIYQKISSLGLALEGVEVIDPQQAPTFEDYHQTYYRLRAHKGITPDNARDVMSGVNHFGTMMVYKGHVDGMVSGSVHSTLNTVRPSLEFVKTKPGCTIMSSVIFMCLEDRVLAYADCAVNPRPTAEQLAEIAIETAKTTRLFDIEPIVAMLSYSSGSSGIGSDVDKVKQATEIVQQRAPDLLVEGPIQYDAAVDIEVAKTKMPNSRVAGRATVFIFPDLNTGNNTYKAVQRSAKTVAIGPIMQGLNKPVNDLSRGCTVADIVNTVAITAIQAQAEKGLL